MKKIAFPNTYVIIFGLIILAVLLTYLIPAGEFDRIKDPASGKMIIVADSFHYIEGVFISLLDIPKYIVAGLNKTSSIIFMVLIVGGVFNIIIETGLFQAVAYKLTKVFSKKEYLIIPAFTTIFALVCTTMGVNTFIGFAPIAIIIARRMGYDAIVGASMVCLGGAVGFSTGTFNPFTTGVAQSIAGLPLFSGLGYRFVCFFVFLIVTTLYIMKYAAMVKKDPTKSVVYDLEQDEIKESDEQFVSLNYKHFLVFLVVLIGFSIIIYGGLYLKFKLDDNSAIFIWMGIIAGAVYGFSPNKIAKDFIAGARKLLFGALMIGIARAIALILDDGKILDTVVSNLGGFLLAFPDMLQPVVMFFIQCLMDGLITSGSGQAAVTMPVMLPVAELIGLTKQTSVLAFNFGDGFTNYILPTSSALMGFLAISNISYEKWMKFMYKLFLIWLVCGSILVIIAKYINYGPF